MIFDKSFGRISPLNQFATISFLSKLLCLSKLELTLSECNTTTSLHNKKII